jgi:hypothetical protein
VQQAAKEQGFGFPVLIDLKSSNWDAWGNTMWPTVYVIDQQGYLRVWWQGELKGPEAKGDEVISKAVEKLLGGTADQEPAAATQRAAPAARSRALSRRGCKRPAAAAASRSPARPRPPPPHATPAPPKRK